MSSKTGIILINNTSYVVNEGISFIGRDPVICSIILTNVTISKQHALIINLRNEYFISDLQSTNGTKLEDDLLIPRKLYELHDNATITLGDICAKFMLQDPTSSFKIPQQLPPRSTQTPTKYKSPKHSSVIQTDIHNLPTQLDEYEEDTQKLFSTTTLVAETSTLETHINVADTQMLDSTIDNSLDLICESQNVEINEKKLSLTNKLMRNTFNTYKDQPGGRDKNREDDLIIAETQAADSSARSLKIYEVDESVCSENTFADADISDSQMSNIKLGSQLCEIDVSATKTNLNSDEILNSDAQDAENTLGETQFDLEDLEYDSSTSNEPNKNTSTVPPRDDSPNLLRATYSGKESSQQKMVSNLNKNIYELETQLVADEVSLNANDDVNNLDETQFDDEDANSLKFRNIHDLETQLYISGECEIVKSGNSYQDNSRKIILEAGNLSYDSRTVKIGEVSSVSGKTLCSSSKDSVNKDHGDQNCKSDTDIIPSNKRKEGIGDEIFEKDNSHKIPEVNGTATVDSVAENPKLEVTQINNELNQLQEARSEENVSSNTNTKISEINRTDITNAPNISNETQLNVNIVDDTIQPLRQESFESVLSKNNDIKENLDDDQVTIFKPISDNTTKHENTANLEETDIFNMAMQKIPKSPENSIEIDEFSKKNITSESNIGKINETDGIFDIPTQIINKEKSTSDSISNENHTRKSTKIIKNTTTTVKQTTLDDKLNDPDDIFDIPTQVITSKMKGTSNNVSNENDSQKSTEIVKNTTTTANQSTHDDKLNDPDDIFDIPTQIITTNMKDASNNILNQNDFQKTIKIVANTTTTVKQTTHDDKLNDPNDIFDIPTQIIGKVENTSNRTEKSNDPDDIFDIPTQVIVNKVKSTSNNILNENDSEKSTKIVDNTTTSKQRTHNTEKSDDPDDIFDIPNDMSNENDFQKSTKIVENTTTIAKQNTDDDKLNEPDDIFDIPTQIITTKMKGASNNILNRNDALEKSTKIVEKTSTTAKQSTHDDKLNDPNDIFDMPTQIIVSKVKNTSNNILTENDSQKNTKIVENTTTIAKPSTHDDKLNDPDDIFDIPTQIITSRVKDTSNNTSNENDSPKSTKIVENTITTAKQSTHEGKLNDPDDIFDVPTQKIVSKVKSTLNNIPNKNDCHKSTKIVENTITTSKQSTHEDKLNDPDDIFDVPTQIITSRAKGTSNNTSNVNDTPKSTKIIENTITTAKQSAHEGKLNDPDDIFDVPTQIITNRAKGTSNNTSNEHDSPKSTKIVAKQSTHEGKLNDPDDIFDVPTQIITSRMKGTSPKSTKIVENTTTIAKPSTHEDKLNDPDDIFDVPTQIIGSKVKSTSNDISNENYSRKTTKIVENTTTIVKQTTHDDKLNNPDDIFDIPTQIIDKVKNTSNRTENSNESDDIFNIPTEKICRQSNKVTNSTQNGEFDISSRKIDDINTETNHADDIYDIPTQKICVTKTYSNTTRLSSAKIRDNIPKTDDFSNLAGKIASVLDTVGKIDVLVTKGVETVNKTVDICNDIDDKNFANTSKTRKLSEVREKSEIKKSDGKVNSATSEAKETINEENRSKSSVPVQNTSKKAVTSTKSPLEQPSTSKNDAARDHVTNSDNDSQKDVKNKKKLSKKDQLDVVEVKRTSRNTKRTSVVEEFISNAKTRKRKNKKLEMEDESRDILESPSKKIKTNVQTTSTNSNKSSRHSSIQLNDSNDSNVNLQSNLKRQKGNLKVELFHKNENTGNNVSNTTQVISIKNIEIPDLSDQTSSNSETTNKSNKRGCSEKNEHEILSEKNKRTRISQGSSKSSDSVSTRGKSSKVFPKTTDDISSNSNLIDKNPSKKRRGERDVEVLQTSDRKELNEASTSKNTNQNNADTLIQQKGSSTNRKTSVGNIANKTTKSDIRTDNIIIEEKTISTRNKKEIDSKSLTIKTVEIQKTEDQNENVALRKKNLRNQNKKELSCTTVEQQVTEVNESGDPPVQQRLSRNKSKSEANATESTNNKNQRKKFKVIFTLFRDEEQEKIVKKLGGKIVDKIKDADVLVTNQIRRSVKLLSAVSHAIPIVSPRWLDVCDHSKQFVDPWDYLLIDIEAEKKFGFKLKDSLSRAKNGLLLDGYTVMVTKSIPADMKDILENSGAKYTTVCPRTGFPEKSFIVSTVEDKSQWPSKRENKNVHIVSAEAIYSSVIRQKLDLKSHLLF